MDICYTPPPLFFSIVRLFLFLILFVIPSVLSSNRHHPHLSNASDQEALLGFLQSAINPSQSLPANWTTNVSFCEWRGITCSSRRRQRVVSLNVSSMGLQEYGLSGHVTTKGDVYSYGIVLLELLTGKQPTHNMFVDGINLHKWVANSFPSQVEEVVDKILLKRTSSCTKKYKDLKCLNELINVGLLCTKESPNERPTMMDIVETLQSIKKSFLEIDGNSRNQLGIPHLLGNTNTTHTNHGESESSSTF